MVNVRWAVQFTDEEKRGIDDRPSTDCQEKQSHPKEEKPLYTFWHASPAGPVAVFKEEAVRVE